MNDTIHLSSGRTFYANRNIVGLPWYRPTQRDRGVAFEGYDGECWVDGQGESGFWTTLTPEERTEIAEHMAKRWREWARGDADDAKEGG